MLPAGRTCQEGNPPVPLQVVFSIPSSKLVTSEAEGVNALNLFGFYWRQEPELTLRQ